MCQALRRLVRARSANCKCPVSDWKVFLPHHLAYHPQGCQDWLLQCEGMVWRVGRGGRKKVGSGGWLHYTVSWAGWRQRIPQHMLPSLSSPSTAWQRPLHSTVAGLPPTIPGPPPPRRGQGAEGQWHQLGGQAWSNCWEEETRKRVKWVLKFPPGPPEVPQAEMAPAQYFRS